MSSEDIMKDLKNRMKGALSSFERNLRGLRTGRATPDILNGVIIEAYGDRVHIDQVANVTVSGPGMMYVQVWDKVMVKAVEKAISEANLGLSAASEGQSIRINIPPLSEERRKEIAKVAHKYAEEGRVALRNVRRDAMDDVKKEEKEKLITEDQLRTISKQIQSETDDFIKKIDDILKEKEQEVMKV